MSVLGKRGAKPKNIDKKTFEKLCGLQCTEEEIADFLDVSADTIERWCLREYHKKFAEIFAEKKALGKISLRRMQWTLAEKSPAMAIFLGKNYLKQRDERDVEVKGQIMQTTLAELIMSEYEKSTNTENT